MAIRVARLAVVVGLLSVPPLGAQSAARRPKLEVVSIKPSPAGGRVSARIAGDRITLENYPLQGLIQAAYGLRPFELSRDPAWIESARYDIAAKAEGPASGPELWAMIQSVLEERFRLKMHTERKEVSVFNLSIATRGKLPEPRAGSCLGSDPTMPPQQAATGKGVVAPCGSILMPAIPGGAGLEGGRVRVPALVSRLTDILGRPVVDKTGFTGIFDLHLKFAFDGFGRLTPSAGPPVSGDAGNSAGGITDPSGLPTIFTAVREQLGLKLESAKAMLEVHVIDNIERPSAN